MPAAVKDSWPSAPILLVAHGSAVWLAAWAVLVVWPQRSLPCCPLVLHIAAVEQGGAVALGCVHHVAFLVIL